MNHNEICRIIGSAEPLFSLRFQVEDLVLKTHICSIHYDLLKYLEGVDEIRMSSYLYNIPFRVLSGKEFVLTQHTGMIDVEWAIVGLDSLVRTSNDGWRSEIAIPSEEKMAHTKRVIGDMFDSLIRHIRSEFQFRQTGKGVCTSLEKMELHKLG